MLTLKYSTLIGMAMFALLIADLTVHINSFIGESNGSTLIVLVLDLAVALALVLLAKNTRWKATVPKGARLFFVALLIWNGVTLVRGAAVAPDYWAWKALLTKSAFMLLAPLAAAAGLTASRFRSVHSAALGLLFPALLLIPAALSFDVEIFQRAAMAVYLLLLCSPFLPRRWQLLVFAVALLSIGINLGYRANIIRVGFAMSLAVLYWAPIRLPRKALNCFWLLAMILPLAFLGLGLADKYDIFRDGPKFDLAVSTVQGGTINESHIDADTRSFLYREVLSSMQRRGSSFVLGQGAGTGYDSDAFRDVIIGKAGRSGSEVGFLNLLLYSGLIGVGLYGVMLFSAAHYAFNYSNNDLCKCLGLFLLFKWIFLFLEDIPGMDLNSFCTWVIVGLCLSKEMRALDNGSVAKLLRPRRFRRKLGVHSQKAVDPPSVHALS